MAQTEHFDTTMGTEFEESEKISENESYIKRVNSIL